MKLPYWATECAYCQCDRDERCLTRDANGRSCRHSKYEDPDGPDAAKARYLEYLEEQATTS